MTRKARGTPRKPGVTGRLEFCTSMVHQRGNLKFVEPTTSHSTVVRKTVPGLGPLRYPNFRTQLPPVSSYSKSASSDPLVRQEPMLFVRHSPQSLKITFTSPQCTTFPQPTSVVEKYCKGVVCSRPYGPAALLPHPTDEIATFLGCSVNWYVLLLGLGRALSALLCPS